MVRSTALLPAIHRTWPGAHVTWLTAPVAAPLLLHHPQVDRILPLQPGIEAVLDALAFDAALCPEKSLRAGALVQRARAPIKRGFRVSSTGAIAPLTDAAVDGFELGLDDRRKFFGPDRSAQQMAAEALALDWDDDAPRLHLVPGERRLSARRLGWNVGSSDAFPYKRLHEDDLVDAVARASERQPDWRMVLLGGPADAARQARVARVLAERGVDVESSSTAGLAPDPSGCRPGIAAVASCGAVVSGDSLGLHLAIALGKPVVAWFGPTSHGEIDVRGRGVRVLADVPCRPCWQSRCDRPVKCFRQLPWAEFDDAVDSVCDAASAGVVGAMNRVVGPIPPPPD